MEKLTLGILGTDYDITTKLIEDIILKTKVDYDQDHIKMNIIINNKLLLKDKYILYYIKQLEQLDSKYLIVTFNDQNIINFIKNNTNMILLNDKNIVNKVLNLHEENII